VKKLGLNYGLDYLVAIFAFAGALGVLQTFVFGKHFIIPTVLLALTILLANFAWYGFKQRRWAQLVNFWSGFLLSSHCFFALFWAKKYREILGSSFEPVALIMLAILALLTWFYASKNTLFKGNH
jgi:hypothetical protein